MATEMRSIAFEDLADDLAGVLERVAREREPVVIEREGQPIAVVAPVRPRRQRKQNEAGRAAFLASAGAWKGLVDVDRFLTDNAASRRLSTRPPVEL